MQPMTAITLEQAERINKISRFLAVRDLPVLSPEIWSKTYGTPQADLLILLGNSLLYVAEQAAEAYQSGIARQLMIVGGIGHSTSYLAENVRKSSQYKNVVTDSRAEAEILQEVAAIHAGIPRNHILLEMESTNCGNNATFALKRLKEEGMRPKSIILMQDPTMQLRTCASFREAWRNEQEEASFVNAAAFIPQLTVAGGEAAVTAEGRDEGNPMERLWNVPRFLSLIMGEIPRLYDDENGYGPRGKGFIGHVDIPDEVMEAYRELFPSFADSVRTAFP